MPETKPTQAQELREAAELLRAAVPSAFEAAVADWLDDRASLAAEHLALETPECTHDDGPCWCNKEPVWACGHCLGWLDVGGVPGADDADACTCYTAALKVARAYLGTTPADAS